MTHILYPPGSRVRLVSKHTFEGGRLASSTAEPGAVGTVIDVNDHEMPGVIEVRWDVQPKKTWWCDESCLEWETPTVSESEVAEAIKSILRSGHGEY